MDHYTNTVTITQNIDHDSPFYDFTISPPLFTYPDKELLQHQYPFKVSILDKWGNPIDNRNPPIHIMSVSMRAAHFHLLNPILLFLEICRISSISPLMQTETFC